MNKKLSTQLLDKAKNSWQSFINGVKEFFDEYDLASTPAFFIFMVVITAGLTVNYFFLEPKVGWIEALAISLLFEIGIGAWKLQSHRVKNSEAQAEIVNWSVWISTLLAFLMLVSSLTGRVQWGYVVALTSVVHVIGFLLFDQNDVIRTNKRKNRMAVERIGQKNLDSDNAIAEAEADLKIIDKITKELSRLHNQYKHLPNEELEFTLEAYRTRLLAEYKASDSVKNATQKLSDVNKDGKIGTRVYAQETDFTKGQSK